MPVVDVLLGSEIKQKPIIGAALLFLHDELQGRGGVQGDRTYETAVKCLNAHPTGVSREEGKGTVFKQGM